MRLTGALLPFIIILFFTVASNTEKYSLTENTSSEKGKSVGDIRVGEIVYNNSGEIYRDGIVDNFNYFKSRGYTEKRNGDKTPFRPSSEPGRNLITVN